MKNVLLVAVVSFLFLFSCATTAVSENFTSAGSVALPPPLPSGSVEDGVTGTIIEIEKYGHTVLDISIDDFISMGFELGDTVDVLFSSGYKLENIPFFNGYYVDSGAPLLRAYPGHTYIAVCINYGKIYEVAGVDVGDSATITLNTKAGRLEDQLISSLVYTDNRDDYSSDEVFANFRAVIPGLIYRSASPISEEHNRASYADKLIEKVGVNAVLNLADTDEEIDSYIAASTFNSPYYKGLYDSGRVIALGMGVDYTSPDFGQKLVYGLERISAFDPPYLIHCTEGKDRAGIVSALVLLFAGADVYDVVDDYMLSYENYYGVEKGSESYNLILERNLIPMAEALAGEVITDPYAIDWQEAVIDYLLYSGATQNEIDFLLTL